MTVGLGRVSGDEVFYDLDDGNSDSTRKVKQQMSKLKGNRSSTKTLSDNTSSIMIGASALALGIIIGMYLKK